MTPKFYSMLLNSVVAFFCLLPITAIAQSSPSIVFEQATIRIIASAKAMNDDSISITHSPITLTVEVRPEDALKLEYIHTLNLLNQDNGAMIALSSPAIITLPNMRVYTPVDILLIAEDGEITQILPNVILANMAQPIRAKVQIKALLFLKGGTTAARAIHRHDTVSGSMFYSSSLSEIP